MFWLKMLIFVQELKARGGGKKIPIRATFLAPSWQMLEALFIHMYNDKHQKTTCNILPPPLICNPRRRTSTTIIVEGTRVQKRSKVGILAGSEFTRAKASALPAGFLPAAGETRHLVLPQAPLGKVVMPALVGGNMSPLRTVQPSQSCPTLCDPMACTPPGSSVHGILLARILEWVAISFSRGSSQPRD